MIKILAFGLIIEPKASCITSCLGTKRMIICVLPWHGDFCRLNCPRCVDGYSNCCPRCVDGYLNCCLMFSDGCCLKYCLMYVDDCCPGCCLGCAVCWCQGCYLEYAVCWYQDCCLGCADGHGQKNPVNGCSAGWPVR